MEDIASNSYPILLLIDQEDLPTLVNTGHRLLDAEERQVFERAWKCPHKHAGAQAFPRHQGWQPRHNTPNDQRYPPVKPSNGIFFRWISGSKSHGHPAVASWWHVPSPRAATPVESKPLSCWGAHDAAPNPPVSVPPGSCMRAPNDIPQESNMWQVYRFFAYIQKQIVVNRLGSEFNVRALFRCKCKHLNVLNTESIKEVPMDWFGCPKEKEYTFDTVILTSEPTKPQHLQV